MYFAGMSAVNDKDGVEDSGDKRKTLDLMEGLCVTWHEEVQTKNSDASANWIPRRTQLQYVSASTCLFMQKNVQLVKSTRTLVEFIFIFFYFLQNIVFVLRFVKIRTFLLS